MKSFPNRPSSGNTPASTAAEYTPAQWNFLVSEHIILPKTNPHYTSNVTFHKDSQKEWEETARAELALPRIIHALQVPYLHPALVSNPHIPTFLLHELVSTYVDKVCFPTIQSPPTPATGATAGSNVSSQSVKWQTEEFWGDIVLMFASENPNLALESAYLLYSTVPAAQQPDVHTALLNNSALPAILHEKIILSGTPHIWANALKSTTLDDDVKTLAFLLLYPQPT